MIDLFNLDKIYKIKKQFNKQNKDCTVVQYFFSEKESFTFKIKETYSYYQISTLGNSGMLENYMCEIPLNTLEDLENDLRRLGIILVKIQPLNEILLKNEEKIILNFDGKSFEIFKIVADAFGLINDQIIYKKNTYDSLIYAHNSFESKQSQS